LSYQTFEVHDRMKVLYQGAVIADTGCRATGDSTSPLVFNYAGSSSQLTVRVEPNCDPSTSAPSTLWNYKLSCP
jgi:hypothetical protein